MASRPPYGGRGLKLLGLNLGGMALRRPPYGGRGLKLNGVKRYPYTGLVVLHTEDVD